MTMPTVSLAPSVLFNLGPLPVTTTMLLQLLVSIIIAITFITVAKRWKKVPGTFQYLVESLLLLAEEQVQKITNDEARTKKIFPLIFTFFIFILVANLITIFPGLGAISYGDISLFRATLADYGMILVMTLIVIGLCQVYFILVNGVGAYLKKWFNFSSPMAFILGLMDIISEFAKILSLSFRLYGNVFAGEVLMAVITALIPYFVPFPFFVITTFSSVIQAYVFALLATIFINTSLEAVESN